MDEEESGEGVSESVGTDAVQVLSVYNFSLYDEIRREFQLQFITLLEYIS